MFGWRGSGARSAGCKRRVAQLDRDELTGRAAHMEDARHRTKHAQVAAGIHQPRGAAMTAQLCHRHIDGESFGDATEVDRHRRAAHDAIRMQLDVRHASRRSG